jgi:hypothetical protein
VQALVLVSLLIAAVAAAISLGRGASTVTFVIFALTVQPRAIAVVATDSGNVFTTTAPAYFGLYTEQLVLILGLLLAPQLRVLRHLHPTLLLAPVLLAVVAVAQSDTPVWVLTGVWQWALLALAWAFGAAIARARLMGRLSDRAIAFALSAPIAAHGVAVVLQYLGLMYARTDSMGSAAVTRMSGFAGHPGNLGKILLLLVIMLLPLAASDDRVAKRLAESMTIVSCILVALSFSRVNIPALGVVVGTWYLAASAATSLKRATMMGIGVAASIPVIQVLLLRHEDDPFGGSRAVLSRTALDQISQSWLFGVGPNDYLPTVGQVDRLAGGGLPVHSVLLLLLAELGVLIFVLVAWPVVQTFREAVRGVRLGGPIRPYAIVAVASAPGIVLILWTGHGMISEVVAPLAFLSCGFVHETLRSGRLQRSGGRPSGHGRPASRIQGSSTSPQSGDVSTGNPAMPGLERRWGQ